MITKLTCACGADMTAISLIQKGDTLSVCLAPCECIRNQKPKKAQIEYTGMCYGCHSLAPGKLVMLQHGFSRFLCTRCQPIAHLITRRNFQGG